TTNALSHFQEDYYAWIGMMSKHLSLEAKNMYCLLIKQRQSLYQSKDCYRNIKGIALPEVDIPSSLYDALDGGQLRTWLNDSSEGSKWLTAHITSLYPEADHLLENV